VRLSEIRKRAAGTFWTAIKLIESLSPTRDYFVREHVIFFNVLLLLFTLTSCEDIFFLKLF